jgi:hypothetical protein
MDREDKQKEKVLEDFYLEIPEEKLMYPIDYAWKFQDGKSLFINDNWKVNLDEGKKIEIVVKEYNPKTKGRKDAH